MEAPIRLSSASARVSEIAGALQPRPCVQSSRVVLIFDEDEAGRLGHEDIATRLAKFVFVRIHAFDHEGAQPENLTAEQISAALEAL